MSQQAIKVGQLQVRYLVDGARSGGLGMFELTIPAGAHVPPPHSHTDNEECVYVLEGVLRYTVDDETRDLEPGDWMSTPRGLYRYDPPVDPRRVKRLEDGGTLWMLGIQGTPQANLSGAQVPGTKYRVTWIRIPNPNPPDSSPPIIGPPMPV